MNRLIILAVTLLLLSNLSLADPAISLSLMDLPATNNCKINFTYEDTTVPNDFSGYDAEVCSIIDSYRTHTYQHYSKMLGDNFCTKSYKNLKINIPDSKILQIINYDETLPPNQQQFDVNTRRDLKMCVDAKESTITNGTNNLLKISALYSIGIIKTPLGSCVAGLVKVLHEKSGSRLYWLVGSKKCFDSYYDEIPEAGLISDYIRSTYGYSGIYPKTYMYHSQTLPF